MSFSKSSLRVCKFFKEDLPCPHEPNCRFSHDEEHLVFCKTLLNTGKCSEGLKCKHSHLERLRPKCHFKETTGRCNPRYPKKCHYRHDFKTNACKSCKSFVLPDATYCAKCLPKHGTFGPLVRFLDRVEAAYEGGGRYTVHTCMHGIEECCCPNMGMYTVDDRSWLAKVLS